MKIISYNVNGIRAALKKGFIDWLVAAKADIVCIQETKAHKDQLDLSSTFSVLTNAQWFKILNHAQFKVLRWLYMQQYGICVLQKGVIVHWNIVCR